jgi:hypothetical protein
MSTALARPSSIEKVALQGAVARLGMQARASAQVARKGGARMRLQSHAASGILFG